MLAFDVPGALALARTLVLAAVVVLLARRRRDRRAATPTPTPTARVVDRHRAYTAADVAAHASLDDLWVIIDGAVYDLTPYVDEHPGGAAALARVAGGDCTAGFRGPQHPSRVFDLVDEYRVGALA